MVDGKATATIALLSQTSASTAPQPSTAARLDDAQVDNRLAFKAAKRGNMREFGVRRYGDTLYYHCIAANAADAADWFAHAEPALAGHDFQALVKDVAKPVNDEIGLGENPSVISVRHGPLTEGAKNAIDLKRTSHLTMSAHPLTRE